MMYRATLETSATADDRVEVISPKVSPVHESEVCMDFDEWAGNLDFEQRKELMTFLWNHPKWHDTCVRAE